MTIDKIVTGGVGYVLSSGDLPDGTLQRSVLYQRRPDYFTVHFASQVLPLNDRTASAGEVLDSHNIRDDALGNASNSIINPYNKELRLTFRNVPQEIFLYTINAKYSGTPTSDVYATGVFWYNVLDFKGGMPPEVKPAMVSEVLEHSTRDGPLFGLTWIARDVGRPPGQSFTAFMDEKDLAEVEEQLLKNPRLLVDTVEHYFPNLVEIVYPREIPVPQIHKPHILEYARKDYREKLYGIERRIERRRQVSVPPPKPKRRFLIF